MLCVGSIHDRLQNLLVGPIKLLRWLLLVGWLGQGLIRLVDVVQSLVICLSLRRPIHLADLFLSALYTTVIAWAALRPGVAHLLLAVAFDHLPELTVALVQLFPSDVPGKFIRHVIKMILAVAHPAHISQ